MVTALTLWIRKGHTGHQILTDRGCRAVGRTAREHGVRLVGTVAVAVERAADGVVLSVTDGCGGIPEDLSRVFDTGRRGTRARTPPAGAGRGLAIVRGIVEAHRGSATVRDVAGGCRFEVRLPTAPG